MAKNEHQKLKLLILADILAQESDAEHPLRMSELLELLAKRGIAAERKSIYSDIAALQGYGMDIESIKSNTTGYYLANRTFELAELKLLVDAVQSSRFLSAKKSRALIHKLESLASNHEAQTLQRQVYATQRAKTLNESVYYNIDTLHSAINADREITFTYFEWTVKKERQLRRGGALYRVSPYALVWDNEFYYLVAYDAAAGHIKHYRVDKMLTIALTDTPRSGTEVFASFDMAEYTKKMFGMFGGNDETIQLAFANRLAGVVLDRFGMDTLLIPSSDTHFTVHVQATVSPQFMGWLASFGAEARLIGPAHLAAAFSEYFRTMLALYD